MTEADNLFSRTLERCSRYREGIGERPVYPREIQPEDLRDAIGALNDHPLPAGAVVDELADAVEPALVATTGPRYFGFVVGGALDAATAADFLTSTWDQPAFNAVTSPAAAVVEEVAGTWLKDLLCLPATASFGFVTGAQAANTVCIAAARHHLYSQAGWDVERKGLVGAPLIRVVANAERHATIDRSLRLLGLGEEVLEPVGTDDQGAIDLAGLQKVLASKGGAPTIVCLQAGNVNSGAFDDLDGAADILHGARAWVHVDGAFGLWAAASSSKRHLVAGIDRADSWATDGHKWLNVPYDSGYAFCAHREAHAASMSFTAAYLTGQGQNAVRAPSDYVPESSRRARGFATWAALRQLGRGGVEELVDRCCSLARRFADLLSDTSGVAISNDVVLNQVLVRFADDDAETDRVVEEVQASGECWMGATTWHGKRQMRISVSNWCTTEADVDRSVKAILQAARKNEGTWR